jgi:hypothetical protein
VTTIVLPCCGATATITGEFREVTCPECQEFFPEWQIDELAFEQAPMMRPLFEEPTAEIERPDPFTGPQGFMIGGEFLPTKEEMAQQYLEAANHLVKAIKRGEIEDYRLTNPVLFLYRHALEMKLKGFMQDLPKTHDLLKLAEEFEATIKRKCDRAIAPWITGRLKEIARVDPNSTAFRYSEYYCKKTKRDVSVDGETYVSLPHLQRAMTVLLSVLDRVYSAACEIELRKRERQCPI